MNQEQSIALFLEGREAWNEWANDLLARKEALEKAGKWKVEQVQNDQDYWVTMSADPSIPEIQNWLDEAFVDFSHLTFQTEQSSDKKAVSGNKSISLKEDIINFSSHIFPSDAFFNSCVFAGIAYFSSSVFQGNVYFSLSTYQEIAYFVSSTFDKRADFVLSVFQRNVNFDFSTFKGVTYFISSTFDGLAFFSSVGFQEVAEFFSSNFKGAAHFNSSVFQENTNFSRVDFKRQANFANAKFEKEADFEAIQVKRAFNLAYANFATEVPDFTQANFAVSPRLDHVQVLPSPQYQSAALSMTGPLHWQRFLWKEKFLPYILRTLLRTIINLVLYPFSLIRHALRRIKFTWHKFINHRENPDEEAYYRALKRLAIQAHDHDNEMKFFAGEIRSRRHVRDKFLSPVGFLRYLVGVLYELTSNFGRSFFRPVAWWFIAFFIFSCAYISDTGLERTAKCTNSNNLSVSQAAYTIGLKNSLLIMGLSKTDTVKRAQACLYGANVFAQKGSEATVKQQNPRLKTNYQGLSKSHNTATTEIPFMKTVYGILHSILSLTFIFLLLLALRNQFKIK